PEAARHADPPAVGKPLLRAQDNRRQAGLDVAAEALFPWWKFEVVSEVRQFLVYQKPGTDSSHFEQHTARLSEVDGGEIAAIADVGDGATVFDQLLLQPLLFVACGDGHRNVVHGPQTVLCRVGVWRRNDVNRFSRTAAMDADPDSVLRFIHDVKAE